MAGNNVLLTGPIARPGLLRQGENSLRLPLAALSKTI